MRDTRLLATVFAALTASIYSAPLPAQMGSAEQIDAYIVHEMAAKKIPGLSYAVIRDGKVVASKTYGIANLETNTPVAPATVFELASLTKQFTSTCILMLAQDGKLRLDDSISKYIDETPEVWRGITIRHLLTHTSGLPIEAIVGHDGSPLLRISTRAAFDFISRQPMLASVGERWSYGDAGYFLLGMVIERASNQTYRDFMQRRVFDPLGMTESSILDRRRVVKNRASVYSLRDGELLNWRRDWDYELPSFFGVFSTVADLVKWDNSLRAGTLLKKASLDEAWAPAKLASGALATPRYGFGWFLTEMGGKRVAEHAGASGTFLLHVVDAPVSVIVLTNLDGTSGPNASVIARQILASFDSSYRRGRKASSCRAPTPTRRPRLACDAEVGVS